MATIKFTGFNRDSSSPTATNLVGGLIMKKTPPSNIGADSIYLGGSGFYNIKEYLDFDANNQPIIPQGGRLYEAQMRTPSEAHEFLKVGNTRYRAFINVTQGGYGFGQTFGFEHYETPEGEGEVSRVRWGSGSGSSSCSIHSICYTDTSLKGGEVYVLYSQSRNSGYHLHRLNWLYFDGLFTTVINFGDDSETGGGEGNFDISTDTIDFPNLPTGSALDTGLINMYKCDSTDLRDFGDYLWGDNFFNQISKIFNDPMESFVSLNLFPVTPAAGETKTPIKIGNLFASKSASEFVTAYPLTSQYLEFDCGTVNINEFFGSALDYNPYTQVQIYLPFIGFQNLSVDDIMDGTITLKYHIDLLTGTCTALIKCNKSNKYTLSSVLYSFAGSMNMSVPISASTYAQAGQTLITALSGIGVGIATGGTGTAVSAAAAGSAMNMLNAKAQIQRSGGVTMNAGALGNLTPYIIITRPIQHKPEDYQNFKGWENNITYTLSTLQNKGYTEIAYVHVDGMTATDAEKTEIENLLKEGVIL